ncbi:MAG: septal ring lytic transglycosylase RlpA family protein [Xanthomonadales bacterium]|nr:septal ring lytic transglycosylase RlpA family protein [Xanthomonadales bacterium]
MKAPPRAAWRWLLPAAVALLLGACASQKPKPQPAGTAKPSTSSRAHHDDTSRSQSERYRQARDGGPDGPPLDVSRIPEPVPKVEPRARYGNKPVYSVLGKTYTLLSDPSGYVERGTASWYGNKFHGYLTSSFEPYDMYAFSAAHKTLPLPSYVRVTNLDNGRSVVVRVNDRGPFHEGRVIDLSYAAAVKIGVWPKGTAPVEVRAIDPARPDTGNRYARAASAPAAATRAAAPTATATTSAAVTPTGKVFLQLGAFGERGNAERAAARARAAGIDPVGIESVAVDGRTVHRVRVGPLADVDAADALTTRAAELGLGVPRVAIEAAR